MITLRQVMSDEQEAILQVFNPGKIQETKKDIEAFNQKTKNFLEAIKDIKINLD